MSMDARKLVKMTSLFLVVLCGVLLCMRSEAAAGGLHVIELNDINLVYKSFLPGGSDPLVTGGPLTGHTLGNGMELTLNTDVFGYMYWNNLVHTKTDVNPDGTAGQFRTVGLAMEYGIHLFDQLDVFYAHHSQHNLDTPPAAVRFPVEDSIGIRINIYSRERHETFF